MATKRKKAKVPTPNIYWRGNRAYGDFRAYTDVGGGREALKAQGSTWGTSDPEIAGALFADRLRQLQELRKGRHGLASPKGTTLAVLVRDHLKMKAEAGTTSRSHMLDLEHRLKAAIEYFGSDRDPATIQAADVREWVRVLRGGGKRKEGTIRHYINALSGAFVRASELRVVPEGYNPVAAIPKGEKPGGKWKAGKAKYFTVADASLLLESARILEEREKLEVGAEGNRVNATPALHAILATFLLTGGRSAEVLGLDVEDVSFDRGLIYFRPNKHRRLKTLTSERAVPLWPQLRDILQKHLFGGDTPRTTGLLFPSASGGLIRDLRKSLDEIGRMAGLKAGEVRTRAFRHTYCSARLETVEPIIRPGGDPSNPEDWTFVEVTKFRVADEMGHGGTELVDRIYGHSPPTAHRQRAVEYRVEAHREGLGDRLRAMKAGSAFMGEVAR